MKRALVVGCSNEVWQEVEAAQKLCTFDTYYVVKMAGIHWDQGFFWWVSLHPEFMDRYKEERRKIGLDDNYKIVAPLVEEVGRHGHHPADRRETYRWPGMTSSGSSGLFAVKLAMDDGHDRVVLAGVPMTKTDGHFARRAEWQQCYSFIDAWNLMKPKLLGHVKSFSGWTRELLGEPTAEWLSDTAE